MGFFGIASLSDLLPVIDEGKRTGRGILDDLSDATAYERAIYGAGKGLTEFGVEAVSFLAQPRHFTPGAIRSRGGSEAAITLNDSKNAARQARRAGTGPRTSTLGEAVGALGSNVVAATTGSVVGLVDAIGPGVSRGFVGGIAVDPDPDPSVLDRIAGKVRYVGRDYNANLVPVLDAAPADPPVPFKSQRAADKAARRAAKDAARSLPVTPEAPRAPSVSTPKRGEKNARIARILAGGSP